MLRLKPRNVGSKHCDEGFAPRNVESKRPRGGFTSSINCSATSEEGSVLRIASSAHCISSCAWCFRRCARSDSCSRPARTRIGGDSARQSGSGARMRHGDMSMDRPRTGMSSAALGMCCADSCCDRSDSSLSRIVGRPSGSPESGNGVFAGYRRFFIEQPASAANNAVIPADAGIHASGGAGFPPARGRHGRNPRYAAGGLTAFRSFTISATVLLWT